MALPKIEPLTGFGYQGNIDDFLANPRNAPAGARVTSTTPATLPATGAGYKAGKLLGKATRLGAKVAGPLAGATQLVSGVADAVANGPSVSNAIQTGVGVASTFSPPARAVATGMTLANMIPDAAYKAVLGIKDTDITGPATKEFLARGGVSGAAAGGTMTGAVGGELAEPAAAPVAAESAATPVTMAPSWRPAPLPGQNTYVERPGVRGIGGIGGVGNTQISGSPATSTNIGNTAGNFMGALIGLKQISGDNAQKLAQQRAAAAALTAQGTAGRGAAAMGTLQLSQQLAAEYLKKNPGDFAGAAAVLHGRSQASKKTIPVGGVGMNPAKDPSLVFDPQSGTTSLVRPTQEITLAQAVASAKKAGTYKSDAQVRADLAKMPNYKLVEDNAGGFIATAEQKAQSARARAEFDALPPHVQAMILKQTGN